MDKQTVIKMLQDDFTRFQNESAEFSKYLNDLEQETYDYMNALMSQITSSSGPLLAKTPKIAKKKGNKITSIPESSEMDTSLSITRSSTSFQTDINISEKSEVPVIRSKRGASVKAAHIIRKQQSINLSVKLRRPSKEGSDVSYTNTIKEVRSKRPKESLVSSEDEDIRPSKHSKTESTKIISKNKSNKFNDSSEVTFESVSVSEESEVVDKEKLNRTAIKRKLEKQNEEENTTLISTKSVIEKQLSNDEPVIKKAHYSKSPPHNNEKDPKHWNKLERISEKSTDSNPKKKSNERITRSSSLIDPCSSNKSKTNGIINNSAEMSKNDTITSMYEDALGKPISIMNSTMNPNTTVTLDKMMNVTVLLEPLSAKKLLNETITLKKASFKEPLSLQNSTMKETVEENGTHSKQLFAALNAKKSSKTQKSLKNEINKQIDTFSDLITDDESSPERKEYKINKVLNQNKRITRSNNSTLSEDEILRTPLKLLHSSKGYKLSSVKSGYKKTALFSPYAKDSVKKRVEAFEQVAISPKQVESEIPVRVTRTKTRALAAASFSEDPILIAKQKLARKSLAKAKKISLAKHAREYDDLKENEYTNNLKSVKGKDSLERSAQKLQAKTTPLGKNRMLQMPNSLNKIQHATPSNAQILNSYTKPLTTTRGNIVTHVESFIQPMRSATKQYDRSTEEKRRRAHDEDARRKREELLKAQAEEKRRKREEKELKNKLAREAKEKLDYEKRLKAEREREEKAKLAQQIQEKQKEEMEKKRIAQLQRAQEKEERRKQEELLRLQRVQEQEEQERLLAEQKRREQEMEKRKQAEMRQQMAEMKMKSQLENKILQKAKAKALAQKQVLFNYKIDSDPDEEESDDENKPKHQIPPWASKHVRATQLAMQQHIPMKLVLQFFDAKKCTPDLRDLFQGIDPKKLKRSSSAIWKTPPRYSMMNCSIIKD